MRVQNTVLPTFSATASVVITIRDTNDNPPVFSMPGGYTIPVPEEALSQRPIGTVVATDEDGGLNGTVSVCCEELFRLNGSCVHLLMLYM